MTTAEGRETDDPAELAEWHAKNHDAAMDPRDEPQRGLSARELRELIATKRQPPFEIPLTTDGRLPRLTAPEPGDRPGSVGQVQTDVTFGTIDYPRVNRRAELLTRAESIVNGARNVQYGDPNADFLRTADMWTSYLAGVMARQGGLLALSPHDVAAMMALLKISRLAWSPDHADNWLDLAGYAACGYDCSDAVLDPLDMGAAS